MKNWIKVGASVIGLFGITTVLAQSLDNTPSFEQVKAKLQRNLGMQVNAIGDSPVDGLLQVVTERGLFYTSKDGKYLLQARVYNLDEGMRNETEHALSDIRLGGLEEFQGNVIEYKAEKEKYVVNIFTDITCGYCRKLHNEMDDYNDLGITVRYLAFPRGGIQSKSYTDMVSVWCAENPQEAMTDAKNGGSVTAKSCANNVAEQYAFGVKVGVNGTPNMILPDGTTIPGYQPAKQLEQALKAM